MSVDHNLSCFDIHQKKAVDGRFPLQPRDLYLRRLLSCAAGEGATVDCDRGHQGHVRRCGRTGHGAVLGGAGRDGEARS